MATIVIDICNRCGECMIDPRILPCAHSFCLKCLESLKESPKCPTCQIKFEIPEAGLKEIKKNEFIECLKNVSKMIIKCELCNEIEAIKFCVDCKFHYCSTCLKPHERIPTSKDHILMPIKNKNVDKTYSKCEIHMKSMDLYCEDCKIFSCDECVALNHVNHKMKNVSEHFKSVIKNLENVITMKNGVFKLVVSSHDDTEKLYKENKIIACSLKKQLYEIGESIKNCVDSIVTKLHGDIDQILQNEYPGDVLITLKDMKNKIKNDIASLERILYSLNYSNLIEMNQEIMNNIEREDLIPNYAYKFNKEDVFKNKENFTDLQEFMKAFKKVQKTKNIKIVDVRDLNLKTSYNLVKIASIQDEIFISDGSNIIKVLSYDGLHFVRQYNCNLLTHITDMLAVDDKLFVAGQKNKYDLVVVKYDNNFRSDPCEFFRLPHTTDIFKLSKSFRDKSSILLIFKDRIYHLSEYGIVAKTIEFSFNIEDALDIGYAYCVCRGNNEICLINNKSYVFKTFSPPKNIFSSYEVYKLATDSYGFIYVKYCNMDDDGRIIGIFVLDYNLNFVSFVDIFESPLTFCYNESRNTLVVLGES